MAKEKELYEGPNNILWYIPILLLSVSIIWFDIQESGYTNLIVFFMSAVVSPIMFVAIATGVTGRPFLNMIGIRGSLISNVSMFLIVSGITIFFFSAMSTYSIRTTGSILAPQFQVVYSPMSSYAFNTGLSTYPTTYIMGYYIIIAFGEEILKFFGLGTATDWFYVNVFRRKVSDRVVMLTLGTILSWAGWILIHIAGNPAVVSVSGFVTGFMLSTLWFLPFYLLAENLIDKRKGVNLKVYSIIGSIGGHFTWDVLVETVNFGILPDYFTLYSISIASIVIGLGLLAYAYKSKNLPIFGYIKI